MTDQRSTAVTQHRHKPTKCSSHRHNPCDGRLTGTSWTNSPCDGVTSQRCTRHIVTVPAPPAPSARHNTESRSAHHDHTSQRQIAQLTGQSQSEVSEILKGRRVMAYVVLVRIAEGLGVPRAWMGLTAHWWQPSDQHREYRSIGPI